MPTIWDNILSISCMWMSQQIYLLHREQIIFGMCISQKKAESVQLSSKTVWEIWVFAIAICSRFIFKTGFDYFVHHLCVWRYCDDVDLSKSININKLITEAALYEDSVFVGPQNASQIV